MKITQLKPLSLLVLLNVFCGGIAHNIQVSTNTFTPQELVEDLLINSGCIQNIQVTNTVGGNFSDTDESYGYFNANGFYQDSNVFTNVLGGVHTVYVSDKNGCGIASATVYVLDFPQFVTPNNDGFHDTWQVSGLNMGD